MFRRGYVEPLAQPGASELPVAADGGVRDAKGMGDLLIRQARKELQLHHLAGGGIGALQPVKERFERLRVDADLRVGRIMVGERYLPAEATLGGTVFAAMVNEHPAHLASGNRQEVGPVLPFDACTMKDAEKRFMDERGGLERVGGAFGGHALQGSRAQVRIDRREQFAFDSGVSTLKFTQQIGNQLGLCRARMIHEQVSRRPGGFVEKA